MKRPSFQFYPGDWLRHIRLRSCSLAARGLWIDMMCFMHQAEPYGYLKVGEKVILPATLARMVGSSPEEVDVLLRELEEAGVFSRDDEGWIYSRRMIRDEQTRQKRAAGGIKGGNPALKKSSKVKDEVSERLTSEDNLKTNLELTPSSSSSSSSSMKTNDEEKAECLALINRHYPKWALSGEKYRDFQNYENQLPWALMRKAVQECMAAGATHINYLLQICGDWAEAGLQTEVDVIAYESRRKAQQGERRVGRGTGGTDRQAQGAGTGRNGQNTRNQNDGRNPQGRTDYDSLSIKG